MFSSHQNQSTTQKKRVELGRKMLKCIPNRVIYMATLTFKNKYQELSKCLLWSIFNQISISYSGSKDVGTDCLNIGLVSVRQKIKFNQYFTNQKKK